MDKYAKVSSLGVFKQEFYKQENNISFIHSLIHSKKKKRKKGRKKRKRKKKKKKKKKNNLKMSEHKV